MINLLLRPLALGIVFWSSILLFTSISTSILASETGSSETEPEKGLHGGRLLKQDQFSIELSIFETGVPPEFRVWVSNNNKSVAPQDVTLTVNLTRLGDVIDRIGFIPQADFLRGNMEIYEPHSFIVEVNATYQNRSYQWQYENFEGRTEIEPLVATAMNIKTEIAGTETLKETIEVFGRLVSSADAQRHITARFNGPIKVMHINLGQAVKTGDALVTIESNESLRSYTITSPIDGVVSNKPANSGEQSDGRILLSILDPSKLTAELSVFPSDRARVNLDAKTTLVVIGQDEEFQGAVSFLDTQLQNNQSVIARVEVDNSSKRFFPGQFVTGLIEVARYSVPLAVKRVGLQKFRDFTVVYTKVNNEYEVRMLTLGREAGEWVEVLGGINTGAEYVTENSYIIKADIEKSGASHDH